MVSLRACEHYKALYGDLTVIRQCSNLIWNAWYEVFENGKLIYSTHETGLFDKYLHHLKQNEKCRWEVGLCLCEVEKLLREIELEWKYITEDC